MMVLLMEIRVNLLISTLISLIGSTVSCNGRTYFRMGSLSEYEKQLVVDMHNRMRQLVALGKVAGQPPAANMKEMKWDNRLALDAQKWAAACSPYLHDQNRHTSNFLVGQNIALKWTTKQPENYDEMKVDFYKDAVSKWFSEFDNFHFDGHSSGKTGHYTQMVWADTNLVGCGFAYYYDFLRGFTKKYVCNYGPSGNVQGRTPYEKGYPNCYAFGLTDSRKYPGLCDDQNQFFFKFNQFIG